jgi:uncharacterized protein
MIVQDANIQRVVMVRLNPGDDILLSLRKAVEQSSIKTGVILNGLGSAQSYHYHVVADTNLPPKEIFPKGEIPFDIVSITGLIIDGRVHAHITFSEAGKAQGGHLEEGCRVLTFAAIAIADLGASKPVTSWDKVGNLA